MVNKKTRVLSKLIVILLLPLIFITIPPKILALLLEQSVPTCSSFQQNNIYILPAGGRCSLSTRTVEKVLIEVKAGSIKPKVLDVEMVQIQDDSTGICGTFVYPVKFENSIIIENPDSDRPGEYVIQKRHLPLWWSGVFLSGPFDGSGLCITCNQSCVNENPSNMYKWALVLGVVGLFFIWGLSTNITFIRVPLVSQYYLDWLNANIVKAIQRWVQNAKIEHLLYLLLLPLVGLVVLQMHAFGLSKYDNLQIWMIHIYSFIIVFSIFLLIIKPMSEVAKWLPGFFLTSMTITLILVGLSRLDWIPVNIWVQSNKANPGFLIIYLLILVSIEEFIKLSPFLLYHFVDPGIDHKLRDLIHGPRMAVFLGVVSGLGFSLVEGAFFLLQMEVHNYTVFMFRIVAGPILHAMFGGISGHYISRLLNKSRPPQFMEIIRVPLLAITLHAVYNAFLFLWFFDRPYLTVLGLVVTSGIVVKEFLRRLEVIVLKP